MSDKIEWQPIETAPELDRVLVCGYSTGRGRTQGYWWWHEDAVYNGKACEHTGATHWAPIVLPPFPTQPIEGKSA